MPNKVEYNASSKKPPKDATIAVYP